MTPQRVGRLCTLYEGRVTWLAVLKPSWLLHVLPVISHSDPWGAAEHLDSSPGGPAARGWLPPSAQAADKSEQWRFHQTEKKKRKKFFSFPSRFRPSCFLKSNKRADITQDIYKKDGGKDQQICFISKSNFYFFFSECMQSDLVRRNYEKESFTQPAFPCAGAHKLSTSYDLWISILNTFILFECDFFL